MRAQVILLAGPSGCGKSTLARGSGLPVLELDHFYLDGDCPELPRRSDLDLVDWDDVRSWDREGAMAVVRALCWHGHAEVPQYDLASDRRIGVSPLHLGSHRCFIAEGIFAANLVAQCRAEGLLADAIVVQRSPWQNFARRLARDLRERRKSPSDLWRRGRALLAQEPAAMSGFIAAGCRPLTVRQTQAVLAGYLN